MRVPSEVELVRLRKYLLYWFATHGRRFPWRRKRSSLYQLVLPELLLQRTRAETVGRFLPTFLTRYPSWTSLADATTEDLEQFLRPLGLWQRRAASLRALARVMAARGGRFPRERVDVEALPGIGQYIANAILLFAQKSPEPLLDVNMARVLERCFGRRRLADIRYDPDLQRIARLTVGCKDAVKINWAILDLAALVCTHREPRCSACPIHTLCETGKKRTCTTG